MIHARLEGEGVDKWIDVLPVVLSKYNLSYHSGIKLSPYDAKKKKYHTCCVIQ